MNLLYQILELNNLMSFEDFVQMQMQIPYSLKACSQLLTSAWWRMREMLEIFLISRFYYTAVSSSNLAFYIKSLINGIDF